MSRLGRVPSVMLLLAGCWSAALIIGAFFVPVYQSAKTPARHAPPSPDTLAGVNGPGVAAVIAVPLLVVLLTGIALWLSPRKVALVIAWTGTGLLIAFNLMAMMSIGIFVLPVTVALVIACGTRQPGPRRMGIDADSPARR